MFKAFFNIKFMYIFFSEIILINYKKKIKLYFVE